MNSSIISSTFQINIPAFQRKSPDSKKTFASSLSGFSVNVLTLDINSENLFFLIWIYPYPVSGRVGLIPMVSKPPNCSTKEIPFLDVIEIDRAIGDKMVGRDNYHTARAG